MVELLAPAGNFISLRAVLENGADAVYFGLDDYNMRANAKNFSLNLLIIFLNQLGSFNKAS